MKFKKKQAARDAVNTRTLIFLKKQNKTKQNKTPTILAILSHFIPPALMGEFYKVSEI